MKSPIQYSVRERFGLWVLAILSFVALNGAFLYGLTRPELMTAAMTNPISLAFIVEALVLMGVFAYLLGKWGVARLSWGWFVALSLLGSMGFALPVVLLWGSKRE